MLKQPSACLQAAMQAISAADADETTKATALGLMQGYDARWSGAKWRVVSVEQEYNLPIINPDTGRKSRTYTHAGKTDAVLEFDGAFYLCDHKTTSEDIEKPDAPYWQRLDIDAQVSGYALSQWQLGVDVKGMLYDVIRKPAIRPRNLSKTDRQQIVAWQKYLGVEVSRETHMAVAEGAERENGELYQIRLALDCTRERPGYYFQRKTIPRLQAEMLAYARELWQMSEEVREARVYGRHYRNTGACMQWNLPCKYLGLCSGRDTPESDKWTRKQQVHNELATIEDDGRSTLTHSRLSVFKTCRQKHYLMYELGLERLDREDEEALFFGTLLHQAIEAWLNQCPKYEGVQHDHESAAGTVSAAVGQADSL